MINPGKVRLSKVREINAYLHKVISDHLFPQIKKANDSAADKKTPKTAIPVFRKNSLTPSLCLSKKTKPPVNLHFPFKQSLIPKLTIFTAYFVFSA